MDDTAYVLFWRRCNFLCKQLIFSAQAPVNCTTLFACRAVCLFRAKLCLFALRMARKQ